MESWDRLEIVGIWGFILEILRFKKDTGKASKILSNSPQFETSKNPK
jgi:hypothetical protein